MKKSLYTIIAMALVISMVSGGCGFWRKVKSVFVVKVDKSDTIDEGSSLQPEDIPVPANFAHQPNESTYCVDGSIRTGVLKYYATEFVVTDDVLDFYYKYMPSYGWKNVASTSTGGEKLSVYIKYDETCEVLVGKEADQVVLTIKISYNK